MKTKQKGWLLALCVLAANTGILPAMAADALQDNQRVLEQANTDLANGDAASAYKRLLPLEDRLAGEPRFDYLFGQAALGVHQDTRAAMAFDRCLAVQPRNGDCRLGMAQAHMQLHEQQSARNELETIQASRPPEKVARVVEQYLGELSGVTRQGKQEAHAWMELTLGWDDNPNVSPSARTIALPGIGGLAGSFTPAPADESTFGEVKAGLAWKRPVNDSWDLLAGANTQWLDNFQVDNSSVFDRIAQYGGYVGASTHSGPHRLGIMAQAQNYKMHGDNYRNLFGLIGQYSRLLSSRTQVSGFLQYNRLDYQYQGNDGLQDVDSAVAGVSLAHSLPDSHVTTYGGFYVGNDERVKNQAARSVGSRYAGLRGGATWFFREAWQTGINLQTEVRDYKGDYYVNPLIIYNKSRHDFLKSADLNLGWQPAHNLTISGRYAWLDNGSNIELRDYDRQTISLGVRYDFL